MLLSKYLNKGRDFMDNPNRKRKQRIVFHASEQECELIAEKMQLASIQNREAYLRKMVLDGYVINLDLSSVKELVFLLSNATNNLNQIAKRANETRNIYEVDIKDLQAHYERLWDKTNGILKELAKIRAQ